MLIFLALGTLLYAVLPSDVSGALRYVVVGASVLCAIPMLIAHPTRLDRDSRVGRAFALTFVAVLLAANQVAFFL